MDQVEVSMTNSKKLAGLIGPSIIAVTLSEALNLHIWRYNIAPVTYLNGTILFIAGLSIVRAHNYWSRTWPVLVTLTGWFTLLGGLFRMFAPEAQQAGQNAVTYIMIALLCVFGIIMTYKAYTREVGSVKE